VPPDGYGGPVKWKLWLAVGALAGGALWVARRRNNRVNADAELWAQATDPVARFGDA
jgi:MYXO-CTERM domain-containing protein